MKPVFHGWKVSGVGSKRLILGGILLSLSVLVMAIAGSFALSLYAIHQSQRQWCATLSLVTSFPAQRHQTPAEIRANERFRNDLESLKQGFGCPQ